MMLRVFDTFLFDRPEPDQIVGDVFEYGENVCGAWQPGWARKLFQKSLMDSASLAYLTSAAST